MAQHDYVIANGTGAAVRSDLNNALAAIVSQNSGATAPSTTYAYMPWADTTTGLFKIRNAANNGWITLYELDGTFSIEAGSASSPGLYFTGDSNTGIYSPGADQFGISTGGAGRLVIDSSGNVNIDSGTLYVDASNNRVGIGTATVDERLHVSGGNIKQQLASATNGGFNVNNGTNDLIAIGTGGFAANAGSATDGGIRTTNNLVFATGTGAPERARIDSSGRLLVGTSTSRSVQDFAGNGPESLIQIEATNSTAIMSIISAGTADASRGGTLSLGRHRNATVGGTPTVVQSGDLLGAICFAGGDGTDMLTKGASIACQVDGTPGADDMPGRLIFSTTADGASSPTERMRITASGRIGFLCNPDATWPVAVSASGANGSGVATDGSLGITTNGATCAYINRNNADGDLIRFYESGDLEGAISVSGSTVTYGGGHLARWSQLPNDEDPSALLKGTVMSNLDEMCEWGEEDNEQLNKTKVSDVEGDPNVAGVFVSTSPSDEGLLDFFVAMTGDMIIRIAEGITVQRGDLLMSAGDGTAKPQDDDIIRSKTIAKVTSTHVTCTYDDGSYCVPCVLMAC
jgi:hypothetical protein